jgi:hypothetical protein
MTCVADADAQTPPSAELEGEVPRVIDCPPAVPLPDARLDAPPCRMPTT